MADRMRLLKVTAGNLRQSHLYVSGHLDFFPKEAFGPAKRNGNGHTGIDIFLDGLNETVTTDIPTEAKTGKPRGFLRCRSDIGRFYKHHGLKPGAMVELRKSSERRYRLRPARPPTRG